MKIGLLTTSWPSCSRRWSGHFVADLAAGLASRGHEVSVVALRWDGDVLETRPGVHLETADLHVEARHLPSSPDVWPLVLGALSRAAGGVQESVQPTLWVANWWPTAVAAPRGLPCVAVLHGSDVDRAEKLPAAFVRGLTERITGTVAVAEHLARRFERCSGAPSLGVCPLGAQCADDDSEQWPDALASWAGDPRRRVLTVARDSPGKGLQVAHEGARQLGECAWAIVTPAAQMGPSDIRRLIAAADVLVVPSQEGRGLPSEGRPHIITQALVAGVPVVGGPNRAVREAMREADQREVVLAGTPALVEAVREAVGPSHERLRAAAQKAGRRYTWGAVLPGWEAALECVTRQRWVERCAGTVPGTVRQTRVV